MLLVLGALESIHASLAVMANSDMPKQLYKEEVIASLVLVFLKSVYACASLHTATVSPCITDSFLLLYFFQSDN